MTINYFSFTERQCMNDTENRFESFKWQNVANNLYIPYDPYLNYHPQYRNYTVGTQIKQADAILLNYPALMNMSQ